MAPAVGYATAPRGATPVPREKPASKKHYRRQLPPQEESPFRSCSKIKADLRSIRRVVAVKGESVDAITRRDWDRRIEALELELKAALAAKPSTNDEHQEKTAVTSLQSGTDDALKLPAKPSTAANNAAAAAALQSSTPGNFVTPAKNGSKGARSAGTSKTDVNDSDTVVDAELAAKYDIMYKTVKFVERKKAVRRLLAAKRANVDQTAIQQAGEDLCYNIYYPRDKIYVGIFAKSTEAEANSEDAVSKSGAGAKNDSVGGSLDSNASARSQRRLEMQNEVRNSIKRKLAEKRISVDAALAQCLPKKPRMKPVAVGNITIRGFDATTQSRAAQSKSTAARKLREQRTRERREIDDVGDRMEDPEPERRVAEKTAVGANFIEAPIEDIADDDFFVV